MSRRREQVVVWLLIVVGVLELLAAFVFDRRLPAVAGASFLITGLLLAFVWDVRPGGDMRRGGQR